MLGNLFSYKKGYAHNVLNILGFKIKIKSKNIDNYRVKILIAYHKKTPLLKNDICIPIHCGRKLAYKKQLIDSTFKNDYQWLTNNMIGDDTGDNISYLNNKFNELTALYWAWKNYDKIGNPDVIGFMHYRTIFNLQSYPTYETIYLDSCGYKNKSLLELIDNKNNFLCTCFGKTSKNMEVSYKEMEQYGADFKFYETFVNILKDKYKKDYKDLVKYNNQNIIGPFKQMFILPKEEFFSYCEWMFPKILELENLMKDYPYEKKQKSSRSIGWLCEHITAFIFGVWLKVVTIKS